MKECFVENVVMRSLRRIHRLKRVKKQNTCAKNNSEVLDLVATVLLFLFPEGQVLLEELDDALGVTEIVFLEFVNLVQSVLESAISELAGGRVVLHDFVVEDREVKSKSKLDGVAGWEGNLVSFFISLECILLNLLKLGTLGVFSDVAVVVTDHLHEEGLRLTVAVLGENLFVNHVDNLLAVAGKFFFDFSLVAGKCVRELGVLRVLLNCSDSAAGSTFGADEVLEGYREEVAFVGGDFSALHIEHLGKEINHVFEALSLLSDAG